MKMLSKILTLTVLTLGIAEFAEARSFGPPPGYDSLPPIAQGCRVAVDKVVRGNFLVAGATSLTKAECDLLNQPSTYGDDPYAGVEIPPDKTSGRSKLYALGLRDHQAGEIIALAIKSDAAEEADYQRRLQQAQATCRYAAGTYLALVYCSADRDQFTLSSNYRVHGDWFGSVSSTSAPPPPPPVTCGAINTSFGGACVYQTSASVTAGTTQTVQNVTAGYTGTLTAVCTSSGQYQLSNWTCTANPPPPPPPPPPPTYDYYWWSPYFSFNIF